MKGVLEEEKEEKQEEQSDPTATDLSQLLLLNDPAVEPAKLRIIGLYGEVDEERAAETTYSLMALKEMGKKEEYSDPEDFESETITTYEPLNFIVSTWGGSAADMFAIYDTMRMVRKDCEIHTLGLGKVMSAGTLLLASGTKGKRKIGKHCRVMIHSVIGGSVGPMHQLDNEMKEVKAIQESYIKAICDETNLTERKLRSLLKKKVNIYLTAEEAVEHGFADIIV